jgi:hypothetical protein
MKLLVGFCYRLYIILIFYLLFVRQIWLIDTTFDRCRHLDGVWTPKRGRVFSTRVTCAIKQLQLCGLPIKRYFLEQFPRSRHDCTTSARIWFDHLFIFWCTGHFQTASCCLIGSIVVRYLESPFIILALGYAECDMMPVSDCKRKASCWLVQLAYTPFSNLTPRIAP